MPSIRWIAIAYLLAFSTPLFAQTALPGYGQRPPIGEVGKLPDDWNVGKFNRKTGEWLRETSRNIKWQVRLGSNVFGSPIVADGRVFVGTNSTAHYLDRWSDKFEYFACLLCFGEEDGKFLWQYSSQQLPSGRVHDGPTMGICSTPSIEGERGWFVTNRGEVVCFDTRGFHDGEDDGEKYEEFYHYPLWLQPFGEKQAVMDGLDRGELDEALRLHLEIRWPAKKGAKYRVEKITASRQWRVVNEQEPEDRTFTITRDMWGLKLARANAPLPRLEADVVWRLDMMEKLGTRQHNFSSCCPAVWKDIVFVCTGNGVDEGHVVVPAPSAPSFVALDKNTGKVLWTSNLPGPHVHHGNWSSPAVGVLGGVPQVIFNGGDGWTYSFHAEEWDEPKIAGGTPTPRLLWKFDTNLKAAELRLGSSHGTRNEPIAPPVLHEGRVYITTGQDAEHGEGPGCIWCVDPTKRGDVSAELLVLAADTNTIVPYDENLILKERKDLTAIPNPNSAVVWKYVGPERNAEEAKEGFSGREMHRTFAPVAIEGDLLFATDYAGFVHCLDVKTGQRHWSHDLIAACWTPPFVADGKIYVCDEDGDVTIFGAFANPYAAAGRPPKNPAEPHDPTVIREVEREFNMLTSVNTSPTASKGVLFIASKGHLYAIQGPKK